jgi:hypothetical protein
MNYQYPPPFGMNSDTAIFFTFVLFWLAIIALGVGIAWWVTV